MGTATRCQWSDLQKHEGIAERLEPRISAVLARAWLRTVFAQASQRGLDAVAK